MSATKKDLIKTMKAMAASRDRLKAGETAIEKLTDKQRDVLDALMKHGPSSMRALALAVVLPERVVDRALQTMRVRGLIFATGRGSAAIWWQKPIAVSAYLDLYR